MVYFIKEGKGVGGKYDPSTLYAYIKRHNETNSLFFTIRVMTFKKAGIITIFNQLTPTDLLKPYKSGYLEPTSLRPVPAQAGDNCAV